MKFEEFGFRGAYHNIWAFDLEEKDRKLFGDFPDQGKANVILGYGYIDHQAGLSFEVLSLGVKSDESFHFFEGKNEVSIKIRIGNILDREFYFFDKEDEYFKDRCTEKIERVDEHYQTSDAQHATRLLELIDPLRNTEYPDDVLVALMKEGCQTEECWCRLESFDEDQKAFMCTLLNKPYQDFGVHVHDLIPVYALNGEKGIVLYSLF